MAEYHRGRRGIKWMFVAAIVFFIAIFAGELFIISFAAPDHG